MRMIRSMHRSQRAHFRINELLTPKGPSDDVPVFHSREHIMNNLIASPDPRGIGLRLQEEVPMTDEMQAPHSASQIEADVDAVIGACGGDPRTAIKALLMEHLVQEQRIERLAAAVSFGYVRGRTSLQSGIGSPTIHEGTRSDMLEQKGL